jgi:hypothetical protein
MISRKWSAVSASRDLAPQPARAAGAHQPVQQTTHRLSPRTCGVLMNSLPYVGLERSRMGNGVTARTLISCYEAVVA